MPFEPKSDSVGIVTPRVEHFDEPLPLSSGQVLPAYDIVFETYGELNADRSNAILICHALSGITASGRASRSIHGFSMW
jgi:homoserine O-acetyltransferase